MQELAAILMLISGLTHQMPLFRQSMNKESIGSSIFGVTYFLIGLGLLTDSSIALISGAIFPAIGLVLGSYIFFCVKKEMLTPIHLLIDILVIGYCMFRLMA